MNASVQRLGRTTPILRRPDDRWLGPGSPVSRVPAMMLLVLVISAAIHAGLIATALLADRPSHAEAETEIAVEIVHDAPPAPTPTAPEKPALRTAVEPEPNTAAPPPPPALAADPTKRDEAKPEQPKPEQSKPEGHRAEAPRPKPDQTRAKPAPSQAADDAEALAAMKRELANLRAEQAALKAAQETAQVASMDPPAARIGPHSFQGIALPSTSETGEATGYESLVFSQLFKAKEAHRHEGLPGTATVVFKVDDSGQLVDEVIVMPSGIAALDAEALQVIREAAPFPPPPPGSRHDFSANVNFVVGAHY